MADLFFKYGGFKLMEKKTFRLSAKLQMGTAVQLDTGTEDYVIAATGGDAQATIGWILPDEQYEANNGTDYVSAGDLVNVALRGPVMSVLCGSTVAVGDYLVLSDQSTLGTANRWASSPVAAYNYAGTEGPRGIALQTGSDGTKVDMIYLG